VIPTNRSINQLGRRRGEFRRRARRSGPRAASDALKTVKGSKMLVLLVAARGRVGLGAAPIFASRARASTRSCWASQPLTAAPRPSALPCRVLAARDASIGACSFPSPISPFRLDVGIFGASLSRQCLQAGLLDEIVIHLAPVLLGGGIRLYGSDGDQRIELERVSLGEADQLTDLRFRVVK
jgi:hypothetical protein